MRFDELSDMLFGADDDPELDESVSAIESVRPPGQYGSEQNLILRVGDTSLYESEGSNTLHFSDKLLDRSHVIRDLDSKYRNCLDHIIEARRELRRLKSWGNVITLSIRFFIALFAGIWFYKSSYFWLIFKGLGYLIGGSLAFILGLGLIGCLVMIALVVLAIITDFLRRL